MHEAMIAQNLLAVITEESAKHNARPLSAKISCGKLYTINDEALCFAFEVIAKGTACEDVKLFIEHKPIQGKCKNCNIFFDVDLSSPRCSQCGGDDFQLLPDAPLLIEEIEFQTE